MFQVRIHGRGGQGVVSAAEILSPTQGSWAFGTFYALFVLACAVHVYDEEGKQVSRARIL